MPYTTGRMVLRNTPIWDPSFIETALWLDADDASTITESGGAVSQWDDKSGNQRNLSQNTTSAKPFYTINGLNGKNILTFQSGDHFGTRSMPNVANEMVLYCVINPTAINAYHNFFERFNASNPMVWIDPSNQWEINAKGLVVGGFVGSTHIAGFRIRTTADQLTFWGNGGAAVTATVLTPSWPNPSTISFFNRSGLQTFRGTVAEIIWIDGAVTEPTRQKIEGYLAWKWGLEGSLPGGHPYKNVPPAP